MLRVVTQIFILLVVFAVSEAARILVVVPTPSISHQVVFRPIVRELINRGHDVVFITTDPVYPKGETPANLTEIDMHDFSYTKWRTTFLPTTSSGNNDLFTQIKTAIGLINDLFFEQVQRPEFQEILNDKSKPFDLLLLQSIARPALALTHILKAPAIQVSSFGAQIGNYEAYGAPVHPMLYPQFLRQRIYNLTFWEKVSELYMYYKFVDFFSSNEALEDRQIKEVFGNNMPDIRELQNNAHMLFLNMNPLWEGNHPVPPGVIYMGGLHQKPPKELPQDLQTFLDSSKNGVVYMSFGTNVSPSQLPREIIQIFFKVFAKLPYNVLWKWDKDELPGKPDNVRVSKWLPQSDLLRHPNIKVFITQAGLQSTDEAITAGVPLIGIPMLGDQWFNTEKYMIHKIGIRLDMHLLSEDRLRNAIDTIIGDKSYYENIRRLNTLMRDQPMKPLDRVLWWIEYVIRHKGAAHLRSPAANISWSEYLELKIVATLLTLAFGVLLLIGLISYCVIRFLRRYVIRLKIKIS